MESLARSALWGVGWNMLGSAVLVIAQIAGTAVTARIVAPQEFGVYAVAQAAAGFATFFTLNSLGSGLLRRSQLGPKTIGTAMALSLASSALVALIVLAGASLWAHAWSTPAAANVVRVAAIALFLSSLATVPIAVIQRRLHFGRSAAIQTASQVIGQAAGVGLALWLHSAFALAAGQTAGAVVLLVATVAVAKDDLQLGFSRAEARELLAFASQVGGIGLSSYTMNTAPSWFVARAFGSYALGLYSRASLIVYLPLTYLSASITKVIYPLYGRIRGDALQTKLLVDEGLILTTGLVWPAFALVAGASPVIVEVLLGGHWHGASSLVTLCALAACGNIPCGLLTNAAEAFGWMRLIGIRQIAFFVALAAAILTVFLADLSLNWLLVGVAVAEWLTYAWTLEAFVKRGLLDGRAVLRIQLWHGAAALVVFAAAAGTAQLLSGTALAEQITGEAAVGLVLVGVGLAAKSRFPAGRVLSRRILAARSQDSTLMRVPTL